MEDRKPHQPKPHKLNSELPKAHQPKPSRLVHHFFYKAIIFTIFLVILPFLPTILPEFINPKIHSISWELLQLIFVGIAVSYGLFSKKNEQNIDHKEHNLFLLDNANSYVSRFLHVSSVFDYEDENPSLFDDNKIKTWSSQYHREKPIVMVAKESSDLEEQIATSSRINEKPLLLPVRSLKSLVLVSNSVQINGESLVSESKNSDSKRFAGNSRKSENGDVMRISPKKVEENLEERSVFPSPIPWRSRSRRLEMKKDDVNPLFSSSQEPRSNLQKNQPSFSYVESESKGESVDATPPPPPQSFLHKPPLHKSKSGLSRKSDFLEMDLIQRKSVRTIRPKLKDNVIKDQLMGEKGNRVGVEVKVTALSGSNHGSILHPDVQKTKLVQEKRGLMDQLMQHNFKKESLMDGLNVENNEEKHFEGRSVSSKEKFENENANTDEGQDVDKKADEFIAKFREQIRLQRIESIRRSTNQHSRNHSQ